MNRITSLLAVLGVFCLTTLSGQDLSYTVGFRTISTYDSSRKYKPNVPASDKLHFRPVDIDLWYPAQISSSDTTAGFADFVRLVETRAGFYDDTRSSSGLTDELLQYFSSATGAERLALDTLSSGSYVNARPIEHRFPLLLYLASYNGMSFENYSLLEKLAARGFVVASVSSIGRYPGNMTMTAGDLFEQINDANFIRRFLKNQANVSENTGLIGYSWGGLAAAVMAMAPHNSLTAVVSLDGSEQFTYGTAEEDSLLNVFRSSTFFRPEQIQCSYLYLDGDLGKGDELPDSIYNFTHFVGENATYLKIRAAKHEDFSVFSELSNDSVTLRCGQVAQQLALDYLQDKLTGTRHFKFTGLSAVDSTFAFPKRYNMSARVFKGSVRDSRSNKALPYVNVGVSGKDIGTGTNKSGLFEIDLSSASVGDTLKISTVGYMSKIILLSDVFKNPLSYRVVHLKESADEFKEVMVTEKRLKQKVSGNKTESRFFGAKFASRDMGSEMAIRIHVGHTPTYLDKFGFTVSYNTTDTATFRVNIYDVRNGQPGMNILRKNILVRIGHQSGNIEVDLSPYDIAVTDDFFVSLEWIDGNRNSGIVFSAGVINKGTYYRKASQGRWKKYPAGVGFRISMSY